MIRFESALFSMGNNTGIEVPPEILPELGGGRRPAVAVRVNGFEFTSMVGSMGGRSLISLSADKRKATGLAGGDPITVELSLQTTPAVLEVPADLLDALGADPAVWAAWKKLAPSYRKAHIIAVESAKAKATRERRIAKIAIDLVD